MKFSQKENFKILSNAPLTFWGPSPNFDGNWPEGPPYFNPWTQGLNVVSVLEIQNYLKPLFLLNIRFNETKIILITKIIYKIIKKKKTQNDQDSRWIWGPGTM